MQVGALGLIGMGLAACGSKFDTGTVTAPPVTAATPLEDRFGTQFGIDFRMAANSNPVKPAAGDIIPLSLILNPMALH